MLHPEHHEVRIQLLIVLILFIRYMFRQILVVQSLYHQGLWFQNQISICEGCGVSQVRYGANNILWLLYYSELSKKTNVSVEFMIHTSSLPFLSCYLSYGYKSASSASSSVLFYGTMSCFFSDIL